MIATGSSVSGSALGVGKRTGKVSRSGNFSIRDVGVLGPHADQPGANGRDFDVNHFQTIT
jgi:hypothetical protein